MYVCMYVCIYIYIYIHIYTYIYLSLSLYIYIYKQGLVRTSPRTPPPGILRGAGSVNLTARSIHKLRIWISEPSGQFWMTGVLACLSIYLSI